MLLQRRHTKESLCALAGRALVPAHLVKHCPVGPHGLAVVHPVAVRLPRLPLLPAPWPEDLPSDDHCVRAGEPDDGHGALLHTCKMDQ